MGARISDRPVIVWFRNDLRLTDHRALSAAVATGASVIAVFVLDDQSPGAWKIGGASRWWLDKSLASLAQALEKRGNRLILRRGAAALEIPHLVAETKASAVYCSRAYEPWAAGQERDLKQALDAADVALKRYGGTLLKEPEDVRTQAGEPFKVYTPFWRALSASYAAQKTLPAPELIKAPAKFPKSDSRESLELHPQRPDWSKGFDNNWTPGEIGARERLEQFLSTAVKNYAEDRNRPDLPGTSRLSPHLHFGEITPAMCWQAAASAGHKKPGADKGIETFLKELVWREFSYTLLVQRPDLPEAPFRPEFAMFPWRRDAKLLEAWQRGQTGYPIVDAGMRELWQTGTMHNRVRMIAASFLIKDLLIPWQQGEAWFWDTLVDADLASNAASWQWVAGSGADAAPYFRIFNPITQGIKFDPNGDYVRRFVPELAKLPAALIHAPWEAPEEILHSAKIVLGKTYPLPVVDHAAARLRALAAYADVKASAQK